MASGLACATRKSSEGVGLLSPYRQFSRIFQDVHRDFVIGVGFLKETLPPTFPSIAPDSLVHSPPVGVTIQECQAYSAANLAEFNKKRLAQSVAAFLHDQTVVRMRPGGGTYEMA